MVIKLAYITVDIIILFEGIYMWKVSGTDQNNTEDAFVIPLRVGSGLTLSWMMIPSREHVFSVQCSPQGCLFATISSCGK
jgi:hypothetical protein